MFADRLVERALLFLECFYSLAVLGAISSKVLQMDCKAPVHASLFHASKSLRGDFFLGADALIKAFQAQSAVVACCSRKITRSAHIIFQRSKNTNSKSIAHLLLS